MRQFSFPTSKPRQKLFKKMLTTQSSMNTNVNERPTDPLPSTAPFTQPPARHAKFSDAEIIADLKACGARCNVYEPGAFHSPAHSAQPPPPHRGHAIRLTVLVFLGLAVAVFIFRDRCVSWFKRQTSATVSKVSPHIREYAKEEADRFTREFPQHYNTEPPELGAGHPGEAEEDAERLRQESVLQERTATGPQDTTGKTPETRASISVVNTELEVEVAQLKRLVAKALVSLEARKLEPLPQGTLAHTNLAQIVETLSRTSDAKLLEAEGRLGGKIAELGEGRKELLATLKAYEEARATERLKLHAETQSRVADLVSGAIVAEGGRLETNLFERLKSSEAASRKEDETRRLDFEVALTSRAAAEQGRWQTNLAVELQAMVQKSLRQASEASRTEFLAIVEEASERNRESLEKYVDTKTASIMEGVQSFFKSFTKWTREMMEKPQIITTLPPAETPILPESNTRVETNVADGTTITWLRSTVKPIPLSVDELPDGTTVFVIAGTRKDRGSWKETVVIRAGNSMDWERF
ncbi:MAG: hypothetical protein A2849_00140 [Candidatus Taylorbacteria bacterium RIFCSPHIGHO2_01_FULL_51_15]|uniref:Uncharacterized protein n=1 Tax=Candidatus Taylorbacteria bacterium RIFCSPHIGHO2_01_FULL_51_15 TaxID=1802304 RepID=A0A1G2MEG0_9BACT|nr:MAG: hypothetical protein A2849_00140 [Candidatus Taylorbacteria bacterium RIFCSPHIGHO2_01_FULL_51_15]